MTAGLVIDGGQKVAAAGRAEAAAAGASRAAGNAAATLELGGRKSCGRRGDGKGVSCRAARCHRISCRGRWDRNGPDLSFRADDLSKRDGVGQVTGRGYAEANLVPTGHSR